MVSWRARSAVSEELTFQNGGLTQLAQLGALIHKRDQARDTKYNII